MTVDDLGPVSIMKSEVEGNLFHFIYEPIFIEWFSSKQMLFIAQSISPYFTICQLKNDSYSGKIAKLPSVATLSVAPQISITARAIPSSLSLILHRK